MKDIDDSTEHETPITQPEPARGGAGGGTTAVGAGMGGSDDENPISVAQREAKRLGHNFIGTEFVLLGLMSCKTGIVAQAMSGTGVTLNQVRTEVEAIIGRGSGFVAVEIPFTPRAKRALELAWDEARQLGHNYIGSEHVLLGIIREPDSVAARILENLGAEPDSLRQKILTLLSK
jgi:ATP-dependent Clp protease ATP-binding subunit ClpC